MPNLRIQLIAIALFAIADRPCAAQRAQTSQASPQFDFHSDFWMNLHHELYHLAQPPGPPPRSPVPPPLGQLTQQEDKAWNDAIAYYRANVIQHDLLFDEEMGRIKEALAGADTSRALAAGVVGAELTRVLDEAAPVYRAHWWPTHDAANRLWIAALHPLLDILGPRLAAQLASAYGAPWYSLPIRVDVTAYAEPRIAAYTTGTDSGHIVIAATDPCVQGFSALETLFHEASHTIVDGSYGPVGNGIAAAATALHQPVPADLWHALMFYTQGEFMRRDLAALGIGYEPESGICDVYRGPWILYRHAAALFWQPYLDGRIPLDSAMTDLVRGIGVAAPR